MNKYRVEAKTHRLATPTQVRVSIFLIVILTISAVFVAVPQSLLAKINLSIPFFSRFYTHLGLDLQGGTHLVYQADLGNIAPSERDSALEGARDVIDRRVNSLGVAEPVVQTSHQAGNSRIIIELAGVLDVNQAIKKIGETPLLEFMETGTATTTKPTSEQISAVEEKNKAQEQAANDIIKRLQKGEIFEELAKQYSEDPGSKDNGGDLDWIGRGIFTPLFEKAIFDEMKPGDLRPAPLQTEFGYHVIKKLEERTTDTGAKEIHAAHILFRTESLNQDTGPIWINTSLSGKNLKRAEVTFTSRVGAPEVSLTFDSEGAKLFEDITRRNVNKPVGIFLDGSAISTPNVNTVITGGQAVITGNFSLEEAKTLAQRLNAGALPVPISLLSQQTVGPSLGRDSLDKSVFAGAIGFLLVALFMIFLYRLPGILAVLALCLYALITVSLFQIIPVTLTLAGVAGFILSIGMAVDANVLIFERVKEEIRKGQNFTNAVETGFTRAWSSIRDSNVSSLITCIILYWFGSSIIRGFAVTLALGIAVSMFSAITVTRTYLRIVIRSQALQKTWLFGVKASHQTHA